MKVSLLSTLATLQTCSAQVVKYAGVNIAGLDFGCDTSGNCPVASATTPGQAGIDQMKHFVTDTGFNAFRIPVSWQFLLNNNLDGTLDATRFAVFDNLMQGCISYGAAMCLIDLHNYARWNGAIIGQGGPTNEQFASVWSQLATKYKNNPSVAFGVMNEPHDLDMAAWAVSVQAAVTAIRNAGATSQIILLPGTGYSSAGNFVSTSGTQLSTVKNPDGSFDNLAFDVHQYLDATFAGTNAVCTQNNAGTFRNLGNWLRTNNRKAMLTETGGGGSESSCLDLMCKQLDAINEYSDVFLGWTGWAAGSFRTTYALSETPTLGSDGSYTDVALVTQCMAGKFKGARSLNVPLQVTN